MDHQTFLSCLPDRYDHWQTDQVTPRSVQTSSIVPDSEGASANLMQLLNWAIACMAPEDAYCQISCPQPALLAGAMAGHTVTAYIVDAKADPRQLKTAIAPVADPSGLAVCQQTLQSFFQDASQVTPPITIGVYFPQVEPDYRSCLMSLLLAAPYLQEDAVIVLPGGATTPWASVIADVQRLYPHCQISLDLSGAEGDPFYPGGIQVLHWRRTPPPVSASISWFTANAHPSRQQVLHVGCGSYHPDLLHPLFHGEQWQEVRLDLDPSVKPDIIASITDLAPIPDNVMDAVWSSHNIEHVYPHEVPLALGAILRVLKPSGFLLMTLPDLHTAAELIIQGGLEKTAYESPAGPIAPIDMIYGYRRFTAAGNSFMAHKTGFTSSTLLEYLSQAGFKTIRIWQALMALWVVAYKQETDRPFDLPTYMASLSQPS